MATKPLHFSIDLETLSSDSNAAIIQIGAVLFDPFGKYEGPASDDPRRVFEANIFFASAMEYGSVSGSTLEWWMGKEKDSPSEAARKSLFDRPITLTDALFHLRKFLTANNTLGQYDIYMWSHATFDAVVLANCFNACPTPSGAKQRVPWAYRNARDLRTILDLAYGDQHIDNVPTGTVHNALDDAWKQAIMVQRCVERLRERGLVFEQA